jgi:hypothetical protein
MQRTKEQEDLVNFFESLWNDGQDDDTDRLGYSEKSSNVRMAEVVRHIIERETCGMSSYYGTAVIDVGCGTGRLLDFLTIPFETLGGSRKIRLRNYIGIDIFNRGDAVQKRLEGIPAVQGGFVLTPYPSNNNNLICGLSKMFKELNAKTFIVALGIVGYGDLGDPQNVALMIKKYKKNSDHGFITIPKDHSGKKNENINYFSAEVIKMICLYTETQEVNIFDHEIALIW